MEITKPTSISVAFLAVVNTVLGLLVVMDVVHWTPTESVVVLAIVESAAAMVLALYFHLTPATKRQPVAIAGSVTALGVAVVQGNSAFQWIDADQEATTQATVLVGLIVGLVVTMFARNAVTAPVSPPTVNTPGPIVNVGQGGEEEADFGAAGVSPGTEAVAGGDDGTGGAPEEGRKSK